MWLHFDDGPNFISLDIKIEPSVGLSSEPDSIAHLESSESNACGFPTFLYENYAGQLERLLRRN